MPNEKTSSGSTLHHIKERAKTKKIKEIKKVFEDLYQLLSSDSQIIICKEILWGSISDCGSELKMYKKAIHRGFELIEKGR